jgi:branched-chain amino acid transport system substrate-binding protein
MRRIAILSALALLFVGLVPSQAVEEPYDFYVILPLTGAAAFLGRDEAPPFAAAEKLVNEHGGIRGRPLHFVIEDDQSNPATAVQVANQIIAKHVPAFLGPAFGATCGAVYPLVEVTGPVMYCMSSVGHPANGSYAFVYNLANKDFIANGFRYLKAKGVRKIGLLETTDATGTDAEKSAQDALTYPDLRDLKVVDVEHFAPTDLTVAAQISRLKAAGVDAICNYVTGTAFGTSLRGIYESGFTGYIFTSSANASREQMRQYVPFLPDKLLFGTLGFQMTGIIPSKIRVAKTTYLDAVHQVGIGVPTIGNMVPWDPIMMMVGALQKYGTGVTPQQVRAYIEGLRDFPGMMGFYDFGRGDQRGLDPKSSGAMRYDKDSGEFVVVSHPGGAPM